MAVSLTDKVKQELAAVNFPRQSGKIAEAAALLRFSGEISRDEDGICFEADFDSQAVVERLRGFLDELLGAKINAEVMAAGTATKRPHIHVTIPNAKELNRRLGLVTRSGVPVVGMPSQVVLGSVSDAEAAWRGAFLAQGILTEPGRSSSLEVYCPGPEVASALVWCAKRIGIAAKTKESRGVDRVVVRDGDAIGALLTRMGAHVTRLEWDNKRLRTEALVSSNTRLENFDDANQRRSARAAEQAANRVSRAMEILGDEVPEHLADAGYLRVKYREASLEELGRHADPPMTKDAVAGRIRRLLTMADKKADRLGIPDTHHDPSE
ncbi:sporulation protein [Corynebacterium phocae]|uniref:Probable cell division protein WhiA n=1 Tax=Corynebacterium phocae TaxID=161895 RepID=A0A1L7D3H5_9CORY|nr:DNA-binding protein WhiA [Corynebacterium phocae]APT92482.1 sporulation protein [Corynebacterium phocae]KAA8725085.1 DNA-binding protein WhiA [Corynebacterium phocae]